MSIETIKHNAQSIIEAYKIYTKLISAPDQDKDKIKKLNKYMIKLSENITKLIKEERENVS